jgi:hypothetical protein
MAESYDELKKENEKLQGEREKDRKIVFALKEQIDKLKQIIKAKSLDETLENIEKDQTAQMLKEEIDKLVIS